MNLFAFLKNIIYPINKKEYIFYYIVFWFGKSGVFD